MSVFAPLDPRGPDQRRKQLVAKLAAQAGAARSAVSRVPMPSSLSGEGPAFRGAARFGGNANVTQSPNILQSVLASLGVLGHTHGEEMSAGRGLPIAPPAPSHGMPLPPQGSAIPTPASAGTLPPPPGPGNGNGVVQAAPPFTPTAPGEVPAGAGSIVGSSSTVVDPGFLTGDNSPVPLGNGLYWDPSSGTILGQQDVNPSAPRSLPGKNSAY